MNFSLEIKNTIAAHDLFHAGDSLLVAVSGGIDSMALLHYLSSEGFNISVAHCNFKLRNESSEKDQDFVRGYCEARNICFHTKSFNTKEYCEKNKVSVQEGARELRYGWFNKLMAQHNYSKLCTAHHLDDSIETYFINLMRSSGIKGLRGIPEKNNQVIRPFLNVTRNDIVDYVNNHQIPFREDESNRDVKYLRNKIRHQFIPLLAEINPDYREVFSDQFRYNKQLWSVLATHIHKLKNDIISTHGTKSILDLEKLSSIEHPEFYMFHLLENFEFTRGEVKEILKLKDAQSGKRIIGSKYAVVKNRNELILEKVNNRTRYNVIIEKGITQLRDGIHLDITELNIAQANISSDSKLGFFDAQKIQFPIEIRNWSEGDRFLPLGMNNHKKLSDFFIDEKIDVFDKSRVPIMVSGNDIIWVLGYRISEKFKIDKNTSKVLRIEWLNEQ